MRMRIRGWQGLASMAVLALLAGRLPAQAPPAPNKPAAVVNGETIPFADVKAILDTMPPPVVPPTADQKREMQQNVLDMLVDDLIMRQFLRKNVPPTSAADIDKEVGELKTVLAKKNMTLADFLKENNQTEAQLRADVAARLQWKAFMAARVTDAMVKAYYDANKVFFDKVTVRASHILVKIGPNTSEADKQAARNKLLAIRQEIVAGKTDFAEAAKKYSECPSKDNKESAGDIGYFAYKFMVLEPFAKAAFSMKVGDLSDVVQTDYGMHLIKVTDRKDGESSNYAAIKEQVREIYGQEIYQQVVAAQRKAAQIKCELP
jgi:parvulin-like peptidyl-prolyl isomerase